MKVENTQPGSSAALLTTRTTTGQRLSTMWLEIPRRNFQHTATNSAFNISSPCECMWSHVGRRRDSATRLALLSQHCSELCLRTYLSTCSMTQPDSAPQLRTPRSLERGVGSLPRSFKMLDRGLSEFEIATGPAGGPIFGGATWPAGLGFASL